MVLADNKFIYRHMLGYIIVLADNTQLRNGYKRLQFKSYQLHQLEPG